MTHEKPEGMDCSKDLPEGQEWILRSVSDMRGMGGGGNWSGTPQSSRAALVKKGLLDDVSRGVMKGRHVQWSRYEVTELGWQVLGAMAFDRGLREGYATWCAKLDAELEAAHEEALRINARWDIEHGLRYRHSEEIEEDVRRVIWKHVEVQL